MRERSQPLGLNTQVVDDRIRQKIECLVRLAKRPGTPYEGEAAKAAAIRLALKYGVKCEFTVGSGTRPTASTPPISKSAHEKQSSSDTIFYQWVNSLKGCGWQVFNTLDTKVGRQMRFRKPENASEIRVTQRKYDVREMEAEHIMRPDPDIHGRDWSYTSYMTISLTELLNHVGAR